MKTLRLVIFCILTVAVTVCRAQTTDPGWYAATNSPNVLMPISNFSSGYQPAGQPAGQPQPSAPVAEVITPQLQALADGLGDNPTNIFNYVHDHINFVLYFGSKKGANLTLLEKSGNDFDQSALLVALLSAAGYSNDVSYQFGWEEIPYNNTSGNNYDLTHWWQLTLPNTNWTTTYNYLGSLLGRRGYPLVYDAGDNNDIFIQRCWVELQYNGTIFQLDPAFKRSVPIATVMGFSITNAMGGAGTTLSNALWNAAAGTDTANYCSNLNEVAIRGQLTAYATNLLNNIQSNAPNASVQQILSGWQTVSATDSVDFSNQTMFASGFPLPTLNWTYGPTNLMSTLEISFAGTNYQWFMPQLHGDRVSLTFSNNGVAQLWQEDTLLAQGSIQPITNTINNDLETSFFVGDSNDAPVWSDNVSFLDEWNPGTPENPGANFEYSNIMVSPVYISQPLSSSANVTIDGISFTATATTGTNSSGYYETTLSYPGLLSYTVDNAGFRGTEGNVGNQLLSTSTISYPSNLVTIAVTHPVGSWDTTNNTFIPNLANGDNQTVTNLYQSTNAEYAILYAFEPDWGWLQQRENKLDAYLQEGLTNGSRQVTCETLNIMGLNWLLQTEQAGNMLAPQLNILQQNYHRIGRMAQELGYGYYVDVYMQETGAMPEDGWNTNQIQQFNTYFDLWSLFSSAMEHGIIEELQNSNLVAASTVKMLQIANTNKEAVYLANSSNWSTVETALTAGGYSSSTLAAIQNDVNNGYSLLVPKVGTNAVSTLANGWAGYGYEARQTAANGSATVSIMKIGGGYLGIGAGGFYGGIVNNSFAVPNSVYTSYSWQNNANAFTETPISTPNPPSADPVDTADGTYQVENTDLSVGQAEPTGITLTRYYNGTRRLSSVGGMTGGWIHNYCVSANNVPAPQAVLGGTTPQQAASMFTATAAAVALYNDGAPDAKNWLTTALIAKWAIDQLTKSGVSVNLGKDTLQFVQQPNGTFTPPANTTATLSGTPSTYVLQMRHGNKFNFNPSGFLSSIVDQYGNTLNLTYNSSNWVTTVKDWQNRHTLTFSYNGTPERLASVSDGTRTISYHYSTGSGGDLTNFTDAQGNPTTYQYDTNHDIVASIDAQNRLVVSNVYNTQGEIKFQYVEGNTSKMWLIDWSGFTTTEFDPSGDQQSYFYDNMGRLAATEDAFGNVSQTFYDGQNHVIQTISPLNETNQLFYDGNNNLTTSVDPLGFTNQFVYDSSNNLIKSIDPRGNATTFGYNSEFSITGQTNGAGDYVNYTYNTSGSEPGTLASSANSGGTTTYGYNSLGQLNSIVYPNGLGTNTFANSYAGDVTNKIDGRGFATAYQYNALRQLTNIIAPTNLVTKIAYDPEGNQATVTDARSNITSQSWSATRKLLSTSLPALSQGTPDITNIYNNCDWVIKTLDALLNPTTNGYDLDGRLISQTDPVQRTMTFGYDGDSRKIATANAASETNSQTWDAKSELISLIDGAGHTSTRGYDGAGNQIILTNRNGNVWQFQFDGANRLTNTISPLHHSTTVAFNHQGLPILVTDPLGQITTNGYDAKGRLTNRADAYGTTLYRYDADDNLTNLSENGLTNNWTFDAYDRVSSCQDVYGNLIQYRYDSNGNLTNLIYPGGRNVYYAYDSNNRMTNVLDWGGRQTTMSYDLDGHLVSVTRPNGTSRTISYDNAGEITNILEQMANGLPIALMRYNWDQAARMSLDFIAPLPHTNAPPLRKMTYDSDNELATFQGPTMGSAESVTVDTDGNLLSGPLTNDAFATYTYDVRNRLQNVGGVTNIYDAMNNRIGQTYGTNSIEYVINPNAKLPQVLERIKNGVITYYIYGPGLLYQVTEAPTGTNTVTYHYDIRGSTIALTGDNGLVTDRMEYSLYATMTYHAGTDDTPFLFNGQFGVMSDPNGLLYMRARYYDPYLCRFLNPDPKGFAAGMNFYAYGNGTPASMTDPSGLDPSAIAANGDTISGPAPSWLTAATPVDLSDPYNVMNYMAEMSSFSMNYAFMNTSPSSMTYNPNFSPVGSMSGAAATEVGYPLWNINPNANPWDMGMAVIMFTPGLDEIGGSLEVGDLSLAANGGDHIVLGLQSQGLEQTASQVGGRTLMSDPNWQATLQTALGNSSTRFTVSLDGVSGSSTYSQFMGAAQQGLGSGAVPGNWFNWEMGQVYQAGRQGTVTFMRGGQVVPNPFH